MSFSVIGLSRSLKLFAQALLITFLVAACGGGGGSGSTMSSFTAGPITGFGSIIVNGVRFDVSNAKVADDDEEAGSQEDLKLGMVAEIEAGRVTTDNAGSHAEARNVHFRSAIIGPVSAIGSNSLVVLGQPVDVTATTVFDERFASGLASIQMNAIVEVFGMLNRATGHYTAKRIQPKPNAPFFKVRGVVSNLDTTARTFMIGGATISYAGLAPTQVPADLANGLLVNVRMLTSPLNGPYVAVKLKDAERRMSDGDEAELKGLVTSVTSQTQFSVDGIPVDASNASFSPDGALITLGAEVEVEGTASNGVIVATKVSVENEQEDEANGFELHGAIGAVNSVNGTFVLRGVTVEFSGATFSNGTMSDLIDGAMVEVKGTLSADGTQLVAISISFER